jgi:hypothetical protein
MKRNRFTVEQIIRMLREVIGGRLGKGLAVPGFLVTILLPFFRIEMDRNGFHRIDSCCKKNIKRSRQFANDFSAHFVSTVGEKSCFLCPFSFAASLLRSQTKNHLLVILILLFFVGPP